MQFNKVIPGMLLLLMSIGFTACTSDDDGNGPNDAVDTTPPQVIVIRPEADEVRTIPENEDGYLHFRATFTDDTELGEAKFDIHESFDDHGHGKKFEPFQYEKIFDLTGTKDTFIDYDISIPKTTVPGKYHLTIYVTDKAGNALADDQKNISFEISNANFGPEWTVNSPQYGSHYTFGDEIDIDIEIRGYIEVEDIHLKLKHEGGVVVYEFDRDHIQADPYHFTRTVLIDNEWPAGEYEIEIEAELENGKHYNLHPELHININ